MNLYSQSSTFDVPPLDRRLPEAVREWIESQTRSLPADSISLESAAGRILAESVSAATDWPAQSRAASDGYAVIAASTAGAGVYNPLPLRLRETDSNDVLNEAEAIPVVWGQDLPQGADAVLPVDDAERVAGGIEVYAPVAAGEHVMRVGDEVHAQEMILAGGHRLRPQDLALLGLLQHERVSVVRRPRVGLLATCRPELEVDLPMISALVRRDGGDVTSKKSSQGDRQRLVDALLGESEVDVILVIGGSGLGSNDHASSVLAQLGALDIRGLAIRPGDTLTLGRAGERPVCVLPGPPLACLSAYELVVRRLIRRLGGYDERWPYGSARAVLSRKIASPVGSLELCRVRMRGQRVEPLDRAGDRSLRSSVSADGFVVVPLQSEGYPEGTSVTVYLYEGLGETIW
jgi:molybdopterin molybdotransferase